MNIQTRLQSLHQRINSALEQANRKDGARLLAVGKSHPPQALLKAYQSGLRHFGENYLQEALAKQAALGHCEIIWHFIGPIQSNKTRAIASHFDWVHSVDRLKIAERLNQHRPDCLPTLNVCIQVNVGGEARKSGVAMNQVAALAEAIQSFPKLRLRGLMTIPPPASDLESQRKYFSQLRELKASLDFNWDMLSMGMSADLEAAILEGATMVRVGTALFGPRKT